ncbi:uncharacterized protein ACA1_273470 [Acanthamoeba castellanii str. Neff]|uniref:Uncharacterized protein n=1 Tax=Acanthamoeba castellanii (strain ATCC 30010 / Neff) TaxID=1257118 RepID=L8GI38_ACACF|nr:uncharacterized protein ACA1_273470 [Acanthamoeba castellanii str. Neff]ELR11856.1 hypothetical protein ACA1_273470 [Acanthamoeba castellanii str. Neff]
MSHRHAAQHYMTVQHKAAEARLAAYWVQGSKHSFEGGKGNSAKGSEGITARVRVMVRTVKVMRANVGWWA